MISLGDYNTLTVVKAVDFGLYLDGGEEGEILLPSRYVPKGCRVGDKVEVFIYLDHDERLVATTQPPLARVGQFACLRVAWVGEHGAFLDWGLMKDLFCPFREQKARMIQGNYYIVYVTIDDESYRLMATAKVERHFDPSRPDYMPGDMVDLLVWQKTDLGYKVIVDNRFPGLVYANQVFRPLMMGQRVTGYVEAVRPDGKVDVALQPSGRRHTEQFADTLLDYLKSNGGHCSLGDKSPAELIADTFKVSKKTYKRAIGDLYRRRLITIDPADGGITLV